MAPFKWPTDMGSTLASRYGAGVDAPQERAAVTLDQVRALPKDDLDRATVLSALTAAELDTRRMSRMVTESPKEPVGLASPDKGQAGKVRPIPKERWGELPTDFGSRPDGTKKGMGFLGPIDTGDGNFATELSVRMKHKGKLVEIPALVPGLSENEVKGLLTNFDQTYTPDVESRVKAFAQDRLDQGLSPFARPGEMYPFPSDKNRWERSTISKRNLMLY